MLDQRGQSIWKLQLDLDHSLQGSDSHREGANSYSYSYITMHVVSMTQMLTVSHSFIVCLSWVATNMFIAHM